MNRRLDHRVTVVMAWVGLSVFLPLIPVICGIAITIRRRETVDLFKLIDGMELFLISLWLVTATAWDLSRHNFRWKTPLRMALIALAAIDLIFLALIYVDTRMVSLSLDTLGYLTIAIGHFLLVALGTIVLQLFMSYPDWKSEGAIE